MKQMPIGMDNYLKEFKKLIDRLVDEGCHIVCCNGCLYADICNKIADLDEAIDNYNDKKNK